MKAGFASSISFGGVRDFYRQRSRDDQYYLYHHIHRTDDAAMAKPLPLPPCFARLVEPRDAPGSGGGETRNEQIKPAIARGRLYFWTASGICCRETRPCPAWPFSSAALHMQVYRAFAGSAAAPDMEHYRCHRPEEPVRLPEP